MKRTMVLLLFCVSFGGSSSWCAADPAFPSEYSRQSYVDQASQELRQVRIQVDMTARRAPLAAQSKFGVVYDALSDAEQALAEVRSANASESTQRRAQFEQLKGKALRLWRDFKVGAVTSEAEKS